MPERFFAYLADTDEAQTLHHHLRYKVFCERKGFEEGSLAEHIPQERDHYDLVSARFLVRDHYLKDWVGTARLVSNEHYPLPAQELGAFSHAMQKALNRNRAAEVSRLATLPLYGSMTCMTHLLQTVILGAIDHSQRHDVEWLVFLVSSGLARVLKRLGVPMEACGPEIEHRGVRRAYRAHVVETGIASVPWTRCLQQGVQGYELYSRHDAVPAQVAA